MFTRTYFLTNENIGLSRYFREYLMFYTKTIKHKSKIRGSGGIIAPVKKLPNMKAEVIDRCNLWLFIEIEVYKLRIIMSNIYFNQNYNTDEFIYLFKEVLKKIEDDLLLTYILQGGDWNGIFGELNQSTDNYLFEGKMFPEVRQWQDRVKNSRKKK